MSIDTLKGAGTDLGGQVKETIGNVTGDRSLQGEGVADQIGGTIQKTYGQAKDAVEDNVRPVIDYVRQFAKDRPFAAAAVAGVLGIAVLNSLRGK